MIGAAGRNVGKTEFACSLIRRFSSDRRVYGVKVTAVDKTDGTCPRGGAGCGVCSSLETHYLITDEADPPAGKDTARLLQAGAEKVYWLRVAKGHLAEGLAALKKLLPPEVLTVCESNSLRLVAEPDLFVMIKDKRSDSFKPTARDVRPFADREVLFDGKGFNIGPDWFTIVDNRWVFSQPATAILLAGGESTRMGRDKGLLPVNGTSMIEHIIRRLKPLFQEILVSSNQLEKHACPGARVVPDRICGLGPFMGVVSCLEASKTDLNFVVACDMPAIEPALVRKILAEARDHDGAVPMDKQGRYEPLFAAYRKSLLPAAKKLLDSRERRITDLYPHGRIRFVEMGQEELETMKSLNTPDDYARFGCRVDSSIDNAR